MPKTIKQLTITAGTPLNVVTALGTVAVEADRLQGKKLLIQMKHGGTGLGQVLYAPVGVIPAATSAAQLLSELAPASASAPGGSFFEEDSNEGNRGELPLTNYWVDGSHSGDVVLVSYE